MPGSTDKNRRPDEHRTPVELTISAAASADNIKRIRGLKGAARKTGERIERRKRANRRALRGQ